MSQVRTAIKYKHGAFLEKADRFSENKLSEIPGPGAYDTNIVPTAKHSKHPSTHATANERYAALQRKLEDLEKVHDEGKKAHAAELGRLKLELSRTQKVNAELTERVDKLKKHSDIQDTRLQELRKGNLSHQSEIKELRVKLRASEHERGQMASKQNDVGDVKKALAALEVKRKGDLGERDRKIVELEKLVATEKRKREGFEVMLQETRGKADVKVGEAHETIAALKNKVKEATEEIQQAQMRTYEVEKREERLISELECARSVVQRVAEEYGRLAASTVSIDTHDEAKRECVSLTLGVFRLERKLANSEAQVVELAHLIRGTKDQSDALSNQLAEAHDDIQWYSGALRLSNASKSDEFTVHDSMLGDCVTTIQAEFLSQANDILETELQSRRLFSQCDELQLQTILQHYDALSGDLQAVQAQKGAQETALSTANCQIEQLKIQLDAAQKEHQVVCQQASEYSAYWEESKAREDGLKREMEARQKRHRTESSALEERWKIAQESIAQLTSTLQQRITSEELLRAELDELVNELAEAGRYQDAYNSLIDEVEALIDRNELAEGEAEKLSKFNAEILGHNNPSQRIMYVDRIRKELTEMKRKHLVALRERDVAYTANDDLRQELDMYKAVTVPIQDKPRTIITHVGRKPLLDQNINVA